MLFPFDSVQHYLEALMFAHVLKESRKDGSFEAKKSQLTTNAMLLATNSLLPYGLSANELKKAKRT